MLVARLARESFRDREREVGSRELARVRDLREALELGVIEAAADEAVEDGARRRDGPLGTDERLDVARHPEIVRVRHAVREDRRLERDDRAPLAEGGRDLGCELDLGVRARHASQPNHPETTRTPIHYSGRTRQGIGHE